MIAKDVLSWSLYSIVEGDRQDKINKKGKIDAKMTSAKIEVKNTMIYYKMMRPSAWKDSLDSVTN